MSYDDERHDDIITKPRLTVGEKRYLEARNDLRLARESYHGGSDLVAQATAEEMAAADSEFADGVDGDDEMSNRDYAASLTVAQIKKLLDDRSVGYPLNAKKPELVDLLVIVLDEDDKQAEEV